jgi:hypothetical protein
MAAGSDHAALLSSGINGLSGFVEVACFCLSLLQRWTVSLHFRLSWPVHLLSAECIWALFAHSRMSAWLAKLGAAGTCTADNIWDHNTPQAVFDSIVPCICSLVQSVRPWHECWGPLDSHCLSNVCSLHVTGAHTHTSAHCLSSTAAPAAFLHRPTIHCFVPGLPSASQAALAHKVDLNITL